MDKHVFLCLFFCFASDTRNQSNLQTEDVLVKKHEKNDGLIAIQRQARKKKPKQKLFRRE
jgi:hypothetical protein